MLPAIRVRTRAVQQAHALLMYCQAPCYRMVCFQMQYMLQLPSCCARALRTGVPRRRRGSHAVLPVAGQDLRHCQPERQVRLRWLQRGLEHSIGHHLGNLATSRHQLLAASCCSLCQLWGNHMPWHHTHLPVTRILALNLTRSHTALHPAHCLTTTITTPLQAACSARG